MKRFQPLQVYRSRRLTENHYPVHPLIPTLFSSSIFHLPSLTRHSISTPFRDGHSHPSRIPTRRPSYATQDHLHRSSAYFVNSRTPNTPVQRRQIRFYPCPLSSSKTLHLLSLLYRFHSLRVRLFSSRLIDASKLSARHPCRPICPQPKGKTNEEELFAFTGAETSAQNFKQIESECLNLNITCPGGLTRESRLPVMVWVHGFVHHLLRSELSDLHSHYVITAVEIVALDHIGFTMEVP